MPRLKGSGGKRAVALLALKRSGIALTRDVVSIANADEELLGTRGATVFVERHPELLRDIEKIVPRSGPSIAALGSIVGL